MGRYKQITASPRQNSIRTVEEDGSKRRKQKIASKLYLGAMGKKSEYEEETQYSQSAVWASQWKGKANTVVQNEGHSV